MKTYHNYDSVKEIITAIMNGETFYRRNEPIHFDGSYPYPFRIHHSFLLSFKDWEDWKIDAKLQC